VSRADNERIDDIIEAASEIVAIVEVGRTACARPAPAGAVRVQPTYLSNANGPRGGAVRGPFALVPWVHGTA
jgi:hypothetical protein